MPRRQRKSLIEDFLEWCNGLHELDPLIKSAIAHLWFVAIHPFGDGNGRITRAIADMTLARSGRGAQRLYSMSAAIERSRIGYYEDLQSITSDDRLDITSWIEWFLDRRAMLLARLLTLDNVMLKNDFWQAHAASDLIPRQAKVLNRLLEGNFQGKLTSSKWAKLTNASQDTASRDIADLMAKGILQNGKLVDAARPTNWFELPYEPRSPIRIRSLRATRSAHSSKGQFP
jgi:Fic family protein